MEINKIYNESCIDTMDKIVEKTIDLIVTSPPYNTSRVGASDVYGNRYDEYKDKMSDEEYISWTLDIFNGYDKVLKTDGCILYNLSYSSENTTLIWMVVAEIIAKTNFMTADCIIWKKGNAIPNNVSKNKLTRIIEYIFIFCRKDEFKTFHANKQVVNTIDRTGQKIYENVFNFVEARNNDGSNDLNKATYSTELIVKLLNIYANPNSIVYDSFMGTGTTAKACLELGHSYLGSEISKEQIEYFNVWLKKNENKRIALPPAMIANLWDN